MNNIVPTQMNESNDQENLLKSSYKNEVDLVQLVSDLWKGKWIIIAFSITFFFLAIAFSLKTEEVWSTKAVVTLPQLADISDFQKYAKEYQAIIDYDKEYPDGNSLVTIVSEKNVFERFLAIFNSNKAKKSFLSSSPIIENLRNEMNVAESDEAIRIFEQSLYSKISISEDKQRTGYYVISFQSSDSLSSFNLLNSYVDFVNNQVNDEIREELVLSAEMKVNAILKSKEGLEAQAANRLQSEIELTKYSLTISETAGIKRPVENLYYEKDELFPINIGSDAIKAKLKALESIKSVRLLEPKLDAISTKLSLFEQIESIDATILSYRYVNEPEIPIGRDYPKRIVFALIGLILGVVLGVFCVLVRYVFNKK